MKTPKLFSVLFMLAAVWFGMVPRTASAAASFQFFYDSLDPYGDWIQVADYGYCWRPSDVDDDWSPYSDGYWAYTDAGWTWVSYEDWGGITYHYGRWANVSGEGWCWVPGHEWGPAWVSWRNSDDYIGWAPLPPEAVWEPSVGFSVWVDNSYDIGPGYYNFCHSYDFGAPLLRPCLIPRVQNVAIIQKTVNITNITYNNVNKVVYNGGPNFGRVNQRSRRPVPALKLVQHKGLDDNVLTQDGRKGGRGRSPLLRTVPRGNQLEVGAPPIDQPGDTKDLKPKRIAKVVDKEKVNKGWASVKDPEERQRLKKTMQQQTANLTPQTAPAKPVEASDLQAVPEKGDPNAPAPGLVNKGQGKGKNKVGAGALGADKSDTRGETAQSDNRGGKNGRGADNAIADEGRGGANKGKGKTETVAVPQPADAPNAITEGERDRVNANARAKDRREASENRQDAARAAVQARRREAAQAEEERDQADRAAARARRQQEAIAAQENAARRENQRANALEERRQQSIENALGRRQQQVEVQRQQQRQEALRERQLESQRQMQTQRLQQHQQQRAIEAQRNGQQQRQMEVQRQMQIQRQQQQAQAAGGGGGGGGGGRGGKQQADDDRGKHKK